MTMTDPKPPIKIPYEKLSPEALQGIIEQFISRDGPDSGHADIPFQRKAEQVMQNIKTGKAIILYDESNQSINIFSKDDPLVKKLLTATDF